MPRLRRRGFNTREKLTPNQWLNLVFGSDGNREPAFSSEAERRAAWSDHREEFLRAGSWGFGLFHRPSAWFDYDAPHIGRLWVNEPTENYFERCELRGRSVMTDEERRALVALRAAGQIPPAAITKAPANGLFRYFRYDGETEQEFAARLDGKKTRWQ